MFEGLLMILRGANKEYTYFQNNFDVGKGIKKNKKNLGLIGRRREPSEFLVPMVDYAPPPPMLLSMLHLCK
jgi:hypothetical protein